ncbi:MAG: type II toxin-antitoxin system RelE/ParE family toxin [bacterium]
MSKRLYTVKLEPRAERQLLKFPRDIQERIASRLLQLESNPRPSGIVKLKGTRARYRLRVGTYRIKYAIQNDLLIINVIEVAHRSESY